jgi:hypothetical protein
VARARHIPRGVSEGRGAGERTKSERERCLSDCLEVGKQREERAGQLLGEWVRLPWEGLGDMVEEETLDPFLASYSTVPEGGLVPSQSSPHCLMKQTQLGTLPYPTLAS